MVVLGSCHQCRRHRAQTLTCVLQSNTKLNAQSTAPAKATRMGGFVISDSDSDFDSDPDSIFTKARSKKPKGKEDGEPLPVHNVPILQRSTTGGKQVNEDALRAYIATLDDDPSSELEDEPKPEELKREDSPITHDDQYHWAYQVKRKTWSHEDNEEEIDWFVCSKVYASLDKANDAAGQEILHQREGLTTGADSRVFSRELDENDMAHYYVELPEGYIRVKVDRFLRARMSGCFPEHKSGWLNKTGWDIFCKTITTTTVSGIEDEDLFGAETSESQDFELGDNIYTVMGEANHQAGEMVLEMLAPKASMRMDDIFKRAEEQKRIYPLLDQLERSKMPFNDTVTVAERKMVDGEQFTITRTSTIWVQERRIVGPRNV
jgi:hypothetical protein